MTHTKTSIEEVMILTPSCVSDERGSFFESYSKIIFDGIVGSKIDFVQDNEVKSQYGVLRGLHCQNAKSQAKLIRVVEGEIFDVAVDIRPESPTCGKWVGHYLSASNRKQLWVPNGFLHGYLVLSDSATVNYKVTEYWFKEHEIIVNAFDLGINITWPTLDKETIECKQPIRSIKDKNGLSLENCLKALDRPGIKTSKSKIRK